MPIPKRLLTLRMLYVRIEGRSELTYLVDASYKVVVEVNKSRDWHQPCCFVPKRSARRRSIGCSRRWAFAYPLDCFLWRKYSVYKKNLCLISPCKLLECKASELHGTIKRHSQSPQQVYSRRIQDLGARAAGIHFALGLWHTKWKWTKPARAQVVNFCLFLFRACALRLNIGMIRRLTKNDNSSGWTCVKSDPLNGCRKDTRVWWLGIK